MGRKSTRGRSAARRLNVVIDDLLMTATEDFAVNGVEADPGVSDDCSVYLFDLLAAENFTAADIERRIRGLPPVVAGRLVLALQRAQHRLLTEYKQRLQSMSSRLNEERCWKFLDDKLTEAQTFGVEADLRAIVFEASGRFANPRMLRLGLRYYRFADK